MVILYNVRTRQLRAHAPFVEMYEWMLWTAVIGFGWLVTCALFVFDFLFVAVAIPIILGVFIWIRFIHFAPILAAYEQKLARQRYFSRTKFARPESTDPDALLVQAPATPLSPAQPSRRAHGDQHGSESATGARKGRRGRGTCRAR